MATRSEKYVGIDVSKDRLDVAVLGERQEKQVNNTQVGIAELVEWMQEWQPELIVVEATGGYQRGVVEGLFQAGLPVAVMNPARVRQFARACGLLAKTGWMPKCWQSSGSEYSPGAMKAKAKQKNS
jgi:transposase